jgi:hypothetical protein
VWRLQRAHRLLAPLETAPEHGWLAIREGEFAFVLENDLEAARHWAERAREIGSSLGVDDVELWALGLEGLALASEGRITDGIRQLDEASAAAIAGEISELSPAESAHHGASRPGSPRVAPTAGPPSLP